MSQVPVNLLDPVTPIGAAGVQGFSQNLNESANRAVERAKIAAQAQMAKAQIDAEKTMQAAALKSTEDEHKKYQEFQSTEAGVERAAAMERDALNRSHDETMAGVAEQADQKAFDRNKALQLQLTKLDLDRASAPFEREEQLLQARLPIAREQKELEATIAATQAAIGKDDAELAGIVDQMGQMTDSTLEGYNTTAVAMEEAASDAVITGLRAAVGVDGPGIVENFGRSLIGHLLPTRGQVTEATKTRGVETAAATRDAISKSAADSFVLNAHLGGAQQEAARAYFSLLLDTAVTGTPGAPAEGVQETDAHKLVVEQKVERLKQLHDEVTGGDVMVATELKHYVRGLGKQLKAQFSEAEKAAKTTKAGEAGRIRRKTADLELKESQEQLFRNLSKIETVHDAIGASTVDRDVLALAYAKLAGYARRRLSQSQVAAELAKDITTPASVDKRLMEFYQKFGTPEEIAQRIQANEAKILEAKRRQSVLDADLVSAETAVKSRHGRDFAQRQQTGIDALLED